MVGLWCSSTGLCWYHLLWAHNFVGVSCVWIVRFRSKKNKLESFIQQVWLGIKKKKNIPRNFLEPQICDIFAFIWPELTSQFLNLTVLLQLWRKPFCQDTTKSGLCRWFINWAGHAFPHIGEGEFSFNVYCLIVSGVSGRESLDRDILLKAIFSSYSTLCKSHQFFFLAFKAS